ncbi:Protein STRICTOSIDINE SYNTHASE-LIKE 3 [Dichanthelium oligosanthes]|uniref:Protein STRICTOSIDINE SYNTHASE-LIKE 3 n=1 Tax=Dichanthelium oligosanthes TaxID=888268 RepID=A0A1E5V6T9_9POAL|nr:Protein STRICTOSIDINE SYNTHASE-LIKE 3 [Dichanthelium oligosanthes]
MNRVMSKLSLLAILLAVLLLLPSATAAAVAKTIDASRSQQLQLPDVLIGPESVAFNAHGGGPYVSISGGRVLSPSYAKNDCGAFSELPPVATESSCSWRLGLRFHNKSGNLYIAEAYMGLMRVGPNGGEAKVLVTKAGGVQRHFTNGADIDQVTSDVYFTDSSTAYTRAQHQIVPTIGDSTGRIMRYNSRTNQVTVLQSSVTIPMASPSALIGHTLSLRSLGHAS